MGAWGARQRPGLVVPAILLVLGFLVAAAVAEERVREERTPAQVAEIVSLIGERRSAIADLAAEARALERRLEEVRRDVAEGSEALRGTLGEIRRLRAGAGAGPLRGPGLTVELADSASSPRTGAEVTDLRIQDVDLRLVVNALWRAGAEAVAVNGRRVASTTAIREAGGTILVNFSPVTSPYRVAAIGDPPALRAGLHGSEIGRQFETWTQLYDLGYTVRTAGELSIPGLGSAARVTWARPAGG